MRIYHIRILLVFTLLLTIANASFSADWMDASGANVKTVLCAEDNQFSWYNGPGGQDEWLLNFGASNKTRMKGYQDITALKFDLTEFSGQTVDDAELHVARADDTPIFALVASTINADWNEGSGWGSNAKVGECCWRWRKAPVDPGHPSPDAEWTFPHSDFSSAAFGNFGSLVSYAYKASETFESYAIGNQTWLRMKLDPRLVHALMLDQYGLAVTDPRGYNHLNPRIYTKDQNQSLAPRLLIRLSNSQDTQPPGAVSSMQVENGALDGQAVLSFHAPTGAPEDQPFGYTVRYSTTDDFEAAEDIARWRIPRPADPDTLQRIPLDDLIPGTVYHFFVQTYDSAGNRGLVTHVQHTLPAERPVPILANGAINIPDPSSRSIRTVPQVLRYWACSEIIKVNPTTGNRMADGYNNSGADDYKKANVVWDAESNTISLSASRNEIVGYQLILERLGLSLTDVKISAGSLVGPEGIEIAAQPNIETFLLHYVQDSSLWYPDAAIPLQAPFPTAFSIPDQNHNPDGSHQSVWCDIYAPKTANPGDYQGTITISANELDAPVDINVKLKISPVVIPDELSFIVDLNGYGNKWDYGNRAATRLRWFQTCQKHRMSLNTLAYGWNANITSDRAPRLSGSGGNIQIADWSNFDEDYGALFDGSAFSPDNPISPYTGPGMNQPVSTFYTTFFESWPIHVIDPKYGFDAQGQGGPYWNNKLDTDKDAFWTDAPDVQDAFTEDYKNGVSKIVKEWMEHAQASGWHDTNFQIYLNHKYSYNNCDALWILEECTTADDFRAVNFFHSLYRQGAQMADAPDVQWHFRIDISDRWGQHYGQLDNLINWYVMNQGSSDWHWPHIRYRNILNKNQEQWVWYGGGPSPMDSGSLHAQRFIQAWAQGLDGGLPYWDNFQTSWSQAKALSTVYSGKSVPGFGVYQGPIMSIRVKMMRQAQQIIELANLLAQQDRWNRQRVTQSLLSKYGDGDWNRSFAGLNEQSIYQLRADLMAALEPFFQSDMNVKGFEIY